MKCTLMPLLTSFLSMHAFFPPVFLICCSYMTKERRREVDKSLQTRGISEGEFRCVKMIVNAIMRRAHICCLAALQCNLIVKLFELTNFNREVYKGVLVILSTYFLSGIDLFGRILLPPKIRYG